MPGPDVPTASAWSAAGSSRAARRSSFASRDSGPLDATGLVGNPDDGDLARRWYAAVENRNPDKVNFKVLAVCEPG